MTPLDDLRRTSAELLLDRHIGAPLRDIAAEVLPEVAERIAAVLADLDHVRAKSGTTHHDACWDEHIGCLAARIRNTLTGEE